MPRILSILLLAFVLLPRIVAAQSSPTVSASSVEECYVGDQIPFRIQVSNANAATPPDLASIIGRDWTVDFVGAQPSSSRFMISVNGRTREEINESVMLLYTLVPFRPGEFTVPSLEVEVKGRMLRTQPVKIKVSAPTVSQGLGSSVEASRAYLGQAVKLSLSWVLSTNSEDVLFNLGLPPGAFDVHPIIPAVPASARGNAANQFADIDFVDHAGGTRSKARGVLSQVDIDGEMRSKFNLDFLLVPKQVGTFECGAARVDFHAVIGQREATIFDPIGSRRSITQRRYAQAPAKSLEVRELPSAGRPVNFSGLVGEYELDAECQPRAAAVGDPLNLTLVLRSKLPFLDPPPLDLSSQLGSSESLAELFRVPRDPILPQVAEGAAIYSAAIRPRSTKVTELPPVELWYFDPVNEAYRAAKSNRLQLKIKPSPVVGLGALEGLADLDEQDSATVAPSAPEVGAAAVPAIVNGLFPPIGTLAAANTPEPSSNPLLSLPAFGAVFAIPAGLWLAGSIFAARRRLADRDRAAWRRRGALRRANRALARATADKPAAISLALRDFIADWFDLPPDAVTTGEAADAVARFSPVLAARLRSILNACDQEVFGPDHTTRWLGNPQTEAIALVREVARSLPLPDRPAQFAAGVAA